MANWLEQLTQKQWKPILIMAGKISTGCVLSIMLAYELGLEYSSTAGIITILSIQNTKMETLQTAGMRFLAFLATIVLAKLSFMVLGYTGLGFASFLFLYVFLCISLGWQLAMSMNAVLATHFLAEKSMESDVLFNETMLFVIGTTMGILMNLHLRRDRETMRSRAKDMDEEIKRILEHMAQKLLVDDKSKDVKYFQQLEKQIKKAEEIAWSNQKNAAKEQMFKKWTTIQLKAEGEKSARWDMQYVRMRKKQCEILYEMHKRICQIQITPIQAEYISVFLRKMAIQYHEENDVLQLLEELEQVFQKMRETPLPSKREEFESRAVLFVFMLNIKEFLDIKKEFHKKEDVV